MYKQIKKGAHSMIIYKDQIEDEVLTCPYCMSAVSFQQMGCCGESSAHFETAYIVSGIEEYILKSENTIEKHQVIAYYRKDDVFSILIKT